MSRHSFSNATLDQVVQGTPFTRDVPKGVQRRALGPVITVAEESDNGRGCPLVDLWAPIQVAPGVVEDTVISAKITAESGRKTARNIALTTGTMEHIEAVIRLLSEPAGCPILMFVAHLNKTTGKWVQIRFDLSSMVREAAKRGIVFIEATGKRGQPLTMNKRVVKYDGAAGETCYEYTTLRVNLGPAIKAGLIPAWTEVDFPSL